MKEYETLRLVKGEDLNHHGTLFAARAASWFVEAGFAAASCEHGSADEIVLRNLHTMSFFRPVKKGEVLRFASRVAYAGNTSLIAAVTVENAMTGESAVEGYITFVTVEEATGKKLVHKVKLDAAADEKELRQRAEAERLCRGRHIENGK